MPQVAEAFSPAVHQTLRGCVAQPTPRTSPISAGWGGTGMRHAYSVSSAVTPGSVPNGGWQDFEWCMEGQELAAAGWTRGMCGLVTVLVVSSCP